jgi:hypothetical protein
MRYASTMVSPYFRIVSPVYHAFTPFLSIGPSSLVPTVLWAQRKDTLYVTVDVPDVAGEKISIESEKVHFSGKSAGKEYAVDLELLHEIDPAVCTLLQPSFSSPSLKD